MVDRRRAKALNDRPVGQGPVIYWMSRDQRASDNWALLYAQELAVERRQALAVAFCLTPAFLEATRRQYDFMLSGLAGLEEDLQALGIPFHLLFAEAADGEQAVPEQIARLARHAGAGAVVTDFSPLRVGRQWRERAARLIDAALIEVDAHNIVPCWTASGKKEFAAYTFRPRLGRRLDEFLMPFPTLQAQGSGPLPEAEAVNWQAAIDWLRVPPTGVLTRPPAGERAAQAALAAFVRGGLADYPAARNNPNLDGQSDLSPYLHFGQIAPQRVALEIHAASDVPEASRAAFLEELIVRRELADNFCAYEPAYESFAGFPPWAQATLNAHRADPRQFIYSSEQLESGETHDPLWNAAQRQMLATGKMHGYLRMYWAKKLLEWSPSPEEALAEAIYLNDRYELDGRDPNGYAGIAWSIGGVHDRAWGERAVFGKIRYMSYGGAKGKFDVKRFVAKWTGVNL
jgi:deoxyribodipyrimidine photo-lyase